MKIISQRQRLLASTIILGAAALSVSAPAFAQPASDAPISASPQTNTPVSQATPQAAQSIASSPTAPSTAPTTVQEVVVTGTLFRRTNTETPSPVTVLSTNEIAKQGLTNITDAVRSISADNSGTIPNAFSAGFAGGAAGVSLRGLTAADTLVLIDGLRTANYPVADDGVRSFVDLNTIPLVNVERVEVLKDGASSIYGSDAVAGVVNIITRQTYKGFEADASYGDSQHGGGQEQRGNFILGHGDLAIDGWNAYISGEYQNDQDITVGQRGFPFNTNNLSSIGGQNNIGGQPQLQSGSIYGSVAPVVGGVTGLTQVLRPSGCGVGSTLTTTAGVGSYCEQNLTTYSDDQPAQVRWDVSGRFTKQINADTQAFATFTYAESKINAYSEAGEQIQTSIGHNTNAITLPAVLSNGMLNPNDPFAAAGEPAAINYDFNDLGDSSTYDNHVYRGVAGIKGDLLGWNYEADLTAAHSDLHTTLRGFIDYAQLESDIADGAYSFINPASNSSTVLSALSPPIQKSSVNNLDSLDLHASRDIYQLPGGPLSLALGGQVRYEYQDDPFLNPTAPDGTPTYLGIGTAVTTGHRTVGAFFFELDAPVDKTLDIDFSGRYDHYSDFGGTFNPKVGIKWTPFRQIAFRGTYSTGFRAPSFSQNGQSASEGFVTVFQSSLPQSFINQHLNAAGQPDAYVQSYTLGEATVSNPNIKPETSQSFTGGFIYEPFRQINISVDYYHINESGIIAQSSPSAVLNAYYAGTPLPANSSIVGDIPDPLNPTAQTRAVEVEAPFVNSNELTTDGVDIDMRANFRLPYDVHFTSELNATDIFGFEYTANGATVNYVGTEAPYNLSSGAGTPKYRANWANSFTWEKATVTGTLNYVSDFKETGADVTGSSDVTAACLYGGVSASCRVRAFYDFDLTGSYQLTPYLEIYANVLNLLDSGPGLDAANYAAINYNPTYAEQGIIGRYFRIGAHVKF